MKRLFAFLIIMVLPFLLFAETENKSMGVKGYYLNSTEETLIMSIMDYNDARLYETYAVANEEHEAGEETIFKWSLTGNSNTTVTVKFTFTMLQAYLNSLYYVPAYTIKMYQNTTETDTGYSDSFYSSTTKTVVNQTSKVNSDYTYTTTKSVSYSGKINNNNSNIWTRSGYATLYIRDYDTTEGSFEYKCNVTVEYSAQ